MKELAFYKPSTDFSLLIPYFDTGLKAGFPSPADDYQDIKIDLNKELIRNQDATFFARVSGKSMIDAGLNDGDILVIDRSLEVHNNKVVVCILDGGFTVKRIRITENSCWLIPENPDYDPIEVTTANDFHVWGVVTHVIKSL